MFKSGDKVKLYNWKDAHSKWSKCCAAINRKCEPNNIYGIAKRSYDRFRQFDDLVVIAEYHDTRTYLVKSNKHNTMWYIPECCMYKAKEDEK